MLPSLDAPLNPNDSMKIKSLNPPVPACRLVAPGFCGGRHRHLEKWNFDTQIGLQKYTFTFKQDGTNLTGKASSEAGDRKREAELKEGKVDGDNISFVEMLNFQDNEIRIAYTGKLTTNVNEIKFTRKVGDIATEEIVAKREPVPAEPRVTRRGGQPIVLGPDDKPAFPEPPAGFATKRE